MPSTLESAAPSATPVATQRTAGIIGLGVALPDDTVSSATIGEHLGVDEQWLVRRTGIRARHRLGPGERVSDLAAAAALHALADAQLDARTIDVVLVATTTADELTPNVAPLVAAAIGAERAGAMDVGSACTGFVAALGVASSMLESARAERVLVVGAEGLREETGDRGRVARLRCDGA
jgi:3-oxoacyl-[acyl-carrier-protein] synthase III